MIVEIFRRGDGGWWDRQHLQTERTFLEVLADHDPFQTQGAPCFEPPANDDDWTFLFGDDPEEEYQP